MTGSAAPASRDDNETTPQPGQLQCPVCAAPFTPVRRQAYCSSPCRKTAFRRRHHNTVRPTVPAGVARRDASAYQCPDCGTRQQGQQRCDDCNTFGQALGLAGTCPHCDGLISAADLNSNT
jgi:Zn finger protein HypA/HybF involved in hydrogenase expression